MAEKTQAEHKLEQAMKKRFPTAKAADAYAKANLVPGTRCTIKQEQNITRTGKNVGQPYYVIGLPGLGE
jgi:hypothetical protein